MSGLLPKIFKSKTPVPVAIAQYERDDFSVGNEHELHWAIIAVTHTEKEEFKGPMWQATDRLYSDGRPKEWSISQSPEVSLCRTMKCLGGVVIGYISGKDVEKLNKLILERARPNPKFHGWNCRDWIVEVIRSILIPNGWANEAFTTQKSLLPFMRTAAQASALARQQYKRPMPKLVFA